MQSDVTEKTGQQLMVAVASYGGGPVTIRRSKRCGYKKLRSMKKDPTIAFARWVVSAPNILSGWSVESDSRAPAGAKEFIDEVFQPLRLHILQKTVFGQIDYGWQPFEKVLMPREDGFIVLRKLKPLLQDLTDILVDAETGAYAGLQQGDVTLAPEETLLFSMEVEGTDWYGNGVLENAEGPYDKWNDVEEAAARYDNKIAGTHLVIKYPLGKSMINGIETDNTEIVRKMMAEWQSSGMIAIPATLKDYIDEQNTSDSGAWSVELLTDNSAGRGAFVERQKYLDSLKVRAMGLPERAVLEGQYGTKADAESHSDFAILNIELRNAFIVQTLNWHAVNHLLRLNYGRRAENTVRIVAAPINDKQKAFLRTVYDKILASQEGFLLESGDIDRAALRDQIGVPTMQPEETGLPVPTGADPLAGNPGPVNVLPTP